MLPRIRRVAAIAATVAVAAVSNNAGRASITDPVLVMYGADDPYFVMPVAPVQQSATYLGSDDVTLELLPDAGHTFMLELAAPRARTVVSEWLRARGF